MMNGSVLSIASQVLPKSVKWRGFEPFKWAKSVLWSRRKGQEGKGLPDDYYTPKIRRSPEKTRPSSNLARHAASR